MSHLTVTKRVLINIGRYENVAIEISISGEHFHTLMNEINEYIVEEVERISDANMLTEPVSRFGI